MVEEIVRGLSKTPKKAMGVFTLVTLEVRDRFSVEELVKEPASLLPSASITNDRNPP